MKKKKEKLTKILKKFKAKIKNSLKKVLTRKVKEFSLMSLMIIFAAFGGNFILNNDWRLRSAGGIFLAISLGMEFILLTKLDMRNSVKKTKEEIESLVDKAEESAEEIENTKREIEKTEQRIEEMKKKIFGWHEPLFSFKSLKDELEDIKDQLGMTHSYGGFSTIKDKLDKLERELNDLKRGLKIR